MATAGRGPRWVPHVHGTNTYDNRHLDAHFFFHTLPAVPVVGNKPGRASRQYKVYLSYSHHCFSKGLVAGVVTPDEELYLDLSRSNHDPRRFCPLRWQLSKGLPAIMANIGNRDCYETGRQNYLTVELQQHDATWDYIVYFTMTRWRQIDKIDRSGVETMGMRMFVGSAYLRKDKPQLTQPLVSFNDVLVSA